MQAAPETSWVKVSGHGRPCENLCLIKETAYEYMNPVAIFSRILKRNIAKYIIVAAT